MKKLLFGIISISILLFVYSCNNTNEQKEEKTIVVEKENIDANTILVYYFHGSVRCKTCISVDEHTHNYLKELFPQKMESGEIVFKSFNIDENEREDLINKYEIYGQTMLFIKGDKVINETDEAFQYVLTKPEKWKQIVEDRIYDLIN